MIVIPDAERSSVAPFQMAPNDTSSVTSYSSMMAGRTRFSGWPMETLEKPRTRVI